MPGEQADAGDDQHRAERIGQREGLAQDQDRHRDGRHRAQRADHRHRLGADPLKRRIQHEGWQHRREDAEQPPIRTM